MCLLNTTPKLIWQAMHYPKSTHETKQIYLVQNEATSIYAKQEQLIPSINTLLSDIRFK